MSTSLPLAPFQAAMLEQLADDDRDCLLVAARGMGIHRLALAFMRVHCFPRSLVLVINVSDHERDAYVRLLTDIEPDTPPQVLTAATPIAERLSLYVKGGEVVCSHTSHAGLVFVTSRILVVDLLTKKLSADLVSGIFVCNAHRVLPTSTEVCPHTAAHARRLFCVCIDTPTGLASSRL